MTSRCRTRLLITCLVLAPSLAFAADPATAPVPAAAAGNPAQGHDYPTQGRVEYVLGCMDDNGHDFAKYATLGGEGGNEFRVDRAKAQTKNFRSIQAEAFRACGVAKSASAAK